MTSTVVEHLERNALGHMTLPAQSFGRRTLKAQGWVGLP
jgi:hypothetical protein